MKNIIIYTFTGEAIEIELTDVQLLELIDIISAVARWDIHAIVIMSEDGNIKEVSGINNTYIQELESMADRFRKSKHFM